MDQLKNLADNRLLSGCVYCGGIADTRDHVPSRTFLEPPYPENLPVVGCCMTCNTGFSKDEEYVACLIECAIAGSTDPTKIKRPLISKALIRSVSLQDRIEKAKRVFDDRIEFVVEVDRFKNVILKLARGHIAFELGQQARREPDELWWKPLSQLSSEESQLYDSAQVLGIFGEVGTRASQRLMIVEAKLLDAETKEESVQRLVMQDWVDVQEGRYRYFALDDSGGVVVMIVIAEFLACKATWLARA